MPYVSKATGVPLAKIAARLMTGRKLRDFLPENVERATDLDTGNLLLREVARLPVGQVPRRRHRARSGDEIHRRSDGRGRQLWRSLRQGASRRRTSPADLRPCLHQRQRSRQAAIADPGETVCRAGLQSGRDPRHGQAHRRRRACKSSASTKSKKDVPTSSTSSRASAFSSSSTRRTAPIPGLTRRRFAAPP